MPCHTGKSLRQNRVFYGQEENDAGWKDRITRYYGQYCSL